MKAIGQYSVSAVLGDGGMGTVYRGVDPRFDRPVAVKVLHSQFGRDPEVTERFRSEAVIQAKLSHPNVVTVYDFVAEGETLAMVMEYVDGKPLDRVIAAAGGPLGRAWAVPVMSQVLSAIGHAHKQGLVHRDLKPSNIMIQEFEGELVAKVMDFGIAKILGAEKMRTATSANMGTLAYMSPEHIRSPKYVDHRSDIYSLGVVLYQMLAGRLPFDADTEFELMRQIVEEPPRPLVGSAPGPAEGLGGSALRAMEKEPAARFGSCAEFRKAVSGQVGWQAAPSSEPAPSLAPEVEQSAPPSPVEADARETGAVETGPVESRPGRPSQLVAAFVAVLAIVGMFLLGSAGPEMFFGGVALIGSAIAIGVGNARGWRFGRREGSFVAGLRFPGIFVTSAVLFVADVLIPDMIPFIDEILLGVVTLVFGTIKVQSGA